MHHIEYFTVGIVSGCPVDAGQPDQLTIENKRR